MSGYNIWLQITGDNGPRCVSSVDLDQVRAEKLAHDIRAEIVDILSHVGEDGIDVRAWAE